VSPADFGTYLDILKQQGHQYDVNTLAYSPNGKLLVTGGEDGKVKVWNTMSGFCFVTFPEHQASVNAVTFAPKRCVCARVCACVSLLLQQACVLIVWCNSNGSVAFSASSDGTVRAFDLVRYRNFRTMTAPTPTQFSSLTTDPSGELVCM
jgi:periodic tryptophan protein 2